MSKKKKTAVPLHSRRIKKRPIAVSKEPSPGFTIGEIRTWDGERWLTTQPNALNEALAFQNRSIIKLNQAFITLIQGMKEIEAKALEILNAR